MDTSENALLHGAKERIYLLKPNLGQLAAMIGVKTISYLTLKSYAGEVLLNNPCEVLVVSIGAQGALLFTKETAEYLAAPMVFQKSTIGVGDSMVAGMVFALAQGKSLPEMVKYGVACGSAATMTEGTQLCKKKDADELFGWILTHSSKSDNIRINTIGI